MRKNDIENGIRLYMIIFSLSFITYSVLRCIDVHHSDILMCADFMCYI